MIKTIHMSEYKGELDAAINKTLTDNDITREKLISIEYSTRVQDIPIGKHDKNGKPLFVQRWFASALIIYEDMEGG